MRTDCRFFYRAAVEGLRELMKANLTRSSLLRRGTRLKVSSGWSVEAGRAQLSLQVFDFACRCGCFAAGSRPYLLLAICLSAVVNLVFASADHIYARVVLRKLIPQENNSRSVPSPKGWGT